MKIYLVGGAVRDKLLNIPIKDKDWVVVGCTKKMLLDKNFQQVGKDFPVFLHPETHEEYALARQERKSGKGHTSFSTNYDVNVTLEEDLIRRDLTINAIAQDKYGNYIDPLNGKKDIKDRILRHISSSFIEDPLRVLRTARFAASLSHLGFQIAPETMELMRMIVHQRELSYLTSHRIWNETEKALRTLNPHVYFQMLYACQALKYLFPEINILYEKNIVFSHKIKNKFLIFMGLAKISILTNDLGIRFSYLCQFLSCIFFLDKKNKNHVYDTYSATIVHQLCKRLSIPLYITELAIISTGFFKFLSTIHYQSSYNIIMLFLKIDAWRKPERIIKLAYLSNFNFYNIFFSQTVFLKPGDFLKKCFSVVNNISTKFILKKGFKGYKIKEELLRLRIKKLKLWRVHYYKKVKKNHN